ncbi:MAG: hypothetical protein KJO09_04245 [Gammaproteobacteria bacterium]|nr:hypothetical protein [Gammaproteobacteria bacterium]
MRHKLFIGSLCALLAAAVVHAEQKTKIEVAISDDDSGEQRFIFDSQDAGFDLQSMLVGESRSITDRNGTTADVRRTEDGFELDLNGKSIDLPVLQEHDGVHGEHEVDVLIDVDDVEVTKGTRKIKVIKSGTADGITIISGPEITAATRQRIAEALEAEGLDGEVMYIDDESYDGVQQAGSERKVRIIRKEVDVTN